MNTPFLLQLLISFFVGGFFIALQTIVAERVSEKMRGIVLTIPSTIALGLFFIGVFESPENASAAAEFATAALAGPYVFMVAYALAARRHGIFWSLLFSTALWALFAVLIIQFPPSSFWQGVFMYFVPPTVLLYFIIIRFPAKSEITPKPFTAYQMFGREIACGFIVALSLFLSRRFNTDFGALFSSYPVLFTSTMVIYHYLYGGKFLISVARSVFFPGALVFMAYTYVIYLGYPTVGITLGTFGAYVVSLLIYLLYLAVVKKE